MTWSKRDIVRMLEMFPIIESADFIPATWPDNASLPTYHPVVDTLWKLCYNSSAYIDPYAVLPEDPEGSEPGTDLANVLSRPEDMEAASLNQIRRYLILCTRAERFCDGYIAGQLESGSLQAALRRLKRLREGMSMDR